MKPVAQKRVLSGLLSQKGEEGFTLVELIVVLVILGILSSVAIPEFTKIIEKTEIAKAKFYLHSAVKECQMKIALGDPDPTYTLPPNTNRFQFPDSGSDGKCLSPQSGNIFTAARTARTGQRVSTYNLNINVVTGKKSTERAVPVWLVWQGIYSPITNK